MSSILRIIKLLKSVNQYSRSLSVHRNVLNILKPTNSKLVNHRFLASQHIAEISIEDTPISQGNSHSLDKILYRLDTDVRRMGRIYRKDVEEVFAKVKKIGSASSIQSLVLLRCCGSLLPEEQKETRINIVTDIWNKLQELNCPLDVSHYNALLKVHLENEYKFSPTDFLSDMEKKGVAPNRVTYQRLIARYCQDGDIDGASKILEFMKSKEFSINEAVFNSLVMGYVKANDMDNAKGIFEVMRNAQLEPSADTYTALACGYAEKGDIKGVLDTLQEAETNDVFLLDKNYLELIVTLAANGHSSHADEIIPKIRKLVGYNQDCVNAIMELTNMGQDDVANKIFLTMTQSSVNNQQIGHFFIRQLVRTERPVEKIIDFCKDLKNKGLNDTGLIKAAESSLVFQKIDHALALLKEMQNEGLPVRCHYFWPILVYYNKQKNENAIYEILQLMSDMGCPANYETLLDYALPGLNILDEQAVVEKLKVTGEPLSTIINPLIQYCLLQGEMVKAKNLVEKYPVRLNIFLCRTLVTAFKESGDVTSTLNILKYLEENPERSSNEFVKSDINGQFLTDYLSVSENNVAGLETLLQEMSNLDMTISHRTADIIHNRLKGDISETVMVLLEKITTNLYDDIPDDPVLPHPRTMDVEELESHLIELKSKGLNTRGALRRLFILCCRKKNLERVLELKEEFDKLNLTYTGSMYAQLIELFVFHEKLEDALHYLSILKEKQPDFPLDTHKILNLASLLIKNDRYDDAIKLIEEHYKKFGVTKKDENLQRNVWRLLTTAADKCNVEMTKKFFDLLVIKYGYTNVSNLVLGPLVKVHMNRDDIQNAFEEYERSAMTYKCTPFKNDLYRKLITISDEEKLQKVLDHSINIHGELNSLFDLASVCIELGNVRQAKKVFETPGIRAHHKKVDNICERYIQQDMVTELEHFVSVTKEVFDIDRDKMYYYLIRAYAKQNNVEKALGVWTKMQEEDVQPTARTLTFLAEYLKKKDHPIPFVVPQKEINIDHERNALLESVQAEDADQALEIKRNLENQGEGLSVSMTSSLIEVLVKKDRLKEANNLTQELLSRKLYPQVRIIKFLLIRLARIGDVETISTMKNLLPPAVLRAVSFDNLLCNAYTNSNRHLELLDLLEQDIGKSKLNFPGGGILGMMKQFPETEERVLKLAERYYKEEKFPHALNMIWINSFLQEKYEKADSIFKSCPEMNERLFFGDIMTEVKSSGNETMGRKLVDVLKSSDTTARSKGAAFSCLIDALVQNGKSDEAVAVLKEGQSCNLELPDFQRPSLQRLESQLQSENKPVPFTVSSLPTRRGTAQNLDSSESSDDDVAQQIH